MVDWTAKAQRFAAVAKKKGRRTVLQLRDPEGTYDTELSGQTVVGHVAHVWGFEQRYSIQAVDGENIQSGDRRVTVAAFDENGRRLERHPRAGDRITLGRQRFDVMDCQVEGPSDEPLCYIVQARA